MRKLFFVILGYFVISISNAQVADKNTYLANFVFELNKKWPNNKTQNLVFHGHSVPTGYYTPAIGVRTFDSYPFYTLKSLKDMYNYAVLNCIITSIGGENSIKGTARLKKNRIKSQPRCFIYRLFLERPEI